MEDICNFLPKKSGSGDIEFYHFVYESNFKKLRQPFFSTKYGAYLVFKGYGVLKTKSKEYPLNPGTMFFTFPGIAFELNGNTSFTYLYITFDGDGAKPLLDGFGISAENCIFEGMEQLSSFWMTSIRRVNSVNAITLTESVLLYSLSFMGNSEKAAPPSKRFDNILIYINENFSDPTLSVKKVADLFFYSEKYLSSLFVKNTGVKFTEYLNDLRVSHATTLSDKKLSISEISAKCGFSDPLYFSKVFKKITGKSPSEYTKSK